MNTKVCTKCKIEQTLDSFHKDNANKNGLKADCKTCRNAWNKVYHHANKEHINATSKAWYQENKEERAATVKAWQQSNPDKCRAKSRRYRAMKELVNEDYTSEDEKFTRELFDHQCFNCSSTENLAIDHHRPLFRGNALTRQNAVLLCQSCNSSKGTKRPTVFYGEDIVTLLDEKLNN